MMNTKSSYRFKVILVKYPFTDSSDFKVRPAVVINEKQKDSNDFFIIPLTSNTSNLRKGEFILKDFQEAGLNIPSAIKRGIYTINNNLIAKELGYLSQKDQKKIIDSINYWLQLK